MAKNLKDIDKAAEEKGSALVVLWQFVKFIIVSLGAFVIQTFLPLLLKLPMSDELLARPYDFFVFHSDGAENNGLGIFIAATVSNILAQIVAFFINREKTFNSSSKISVTLPIYVVFTIALICFSAWLTPTLQGFFITKGLSEDVSLSITGACCGAIQFFLYFPVDKLLFSKKKEK